MKDVLKVSVKNIQAIEDACIEVEGFTGVVGRSNSGKSALIRGIFAALTNKSPKGIFRFNTKESRVTLDDERRNIHIEWRKGDNINKYTVNGKEHTKVGKEPPPELADWGFKTVKVNEDTIDVQFARQHQYLFLLDKSGGFVADFISKITKADILTGALKDCESDYRKANESIKHNEKELQSLNEDLTKFESLDYFHDRVKALADEKANLQASNKRIVEIEGFIESKDTLVAEYKKLSDVPNIVEAAFDLADLKKVKDWADEVEDGKQRLLSARKVDDCNIPELEFDTEILAVFDQFFDMEAKSNIEIPEIPQCELDVKSVQEIGALIEQLKALQLEDQQTEEALQQNEKGLEQDRIDLARLEKQLGKCPLCKHDFKGAHEHTELSL